MTPLELLVAELRSRQLTVAVAESLTGGLLVAELVSVAGVSEVLLGGVVAYDTRIKSSVVGVDADLLAREGPVHPEVALQLADRVRVALAVDSRPARVGLATTGVAGPGAQDGLPAGTAYIAVALDERIEVRRLALDGDRGAIRTAVVSESLMLLRDVLGLPAPGRGLQE